MLGFRLQIFGQYQGLLRNFCERSQRVSPLVIVYSSGVPGTGLMSVSGGGRGLCSVITGAVSGLEGGCSASCARPASDSAIAPARAALRHRLIVLVRIYRLLKSLQERARRRRFGRIGPIAVELLQDLLRL